MKVKTLMLALLTTVGVAQAQWSSTGTTEPIYRAGSVGVGISGAPTQKLDVAGNINMAGAAGRRIFMGGAGGSTFGIAYDAGNPNYGIFYTEAAIDYVSLSPHGDATNGVINVMGNGRVGIGTISPSARLSVYQSSNTDWAAHINNDGGNGRGLKIKGGDGSSSTPLLQIDDNLDHNRFTVLTNGLVGIGTSNPAWTLDVNGQIASRGQAVIDVSSTEIGIGDIASGDGFRDLLHFYTHDAKRMTLDGGGNLIIGTGTPMDRLEIQGGGMRLNRITSPLTGTPGIGQIFQLQNLVGTSDGIVLQADLHQFRNYDGVPEVTITNGNVGIGTTTPGSFKLAVNGKIWTQEVNVAMTNPGPDYVFEEDYGLLSLSEIETYIKTNKHLPEVPSAQEMDANGLNLKEMNLLLLKKVEELTLHLIEKNRELKKLENRVEQLENKN